MNTIQQKKQYNPPGNGATWINHIIMMLSRRNRNGEEYVKGQKNDE